MVVVQYSRTWWRLSAMRSTLPSLTPVRSVCHSAHHLWRSAPLPEPDPKYRILHELGAGGMGTVFKGLQCGQAGFQRPIVIKQVRIPDPAHIELLVEEAKRYAVLDHENIGRIVDFEIVGGERCIILEYIDGWSLVEFLARHRELGQLPDVELSVFIVSRVCRAPAVRVRAIDASSTATSARATS